MSHKAERLKRKALLLSQIQQQRLDLTAARRDWWTPPVSMIAGGTPSSACVPGRWSAAASWPYGRCAIPVC